MGFIQDILDSMLYEIAKMWVGLFSNLGRTVFYIEEGLANVLTARVMDGLFTFMSAFAVSLVVLKILKKGFWTYILWRDGDPDTPIRQVVINVALSVACVICFPTLYGWFADVCLWLIERLSSISFQTMTSELEAQNMLAIVASLSAFGFVSILVTLIYFVMLFILYLHFIKRSAELFLLRLGFPLACLGLLDSDNGVFATTVKTFLQVALTTICQLFCMMCSMTIFVRSHATFANLFFCIAFCMAAFGTPRMLQFILMQTGGGGGVVQKASGALHTVSLVKGLLGK